MSSTVLRLHVYLTLVLPCSCDFHPLYQALLGDPTIRLHPLTYGPNLTGLFVYPNVPGPFHGIIVAPDADGRNSFEDSKAVALARQGYAALAADMKYGNSGDEGEDTRTNTLKQFILAYNEVRGLPFIGKIASIGYGLGGLTILDAVRLNLVNLTAIVCIHAVLRPILNETHSVDEPLSRSAHTKVLMLDGWEDPLNPKETIDETLRQLDQLHIDWQLHVFSGARHAFSLPESDVGNITQFNKEASRQAWIETLMFLESSIREI